MKSAFVIEERSPSWLCLRSLLCGLACTARRHPRSLGCVCVSSSCSSMIRHQGIGHVTTTGDWSKPLFNLTVLRSGEDVQNETGRPQPRSWQTAAHQGTATTRFPGQLRAVWEGALLDRPSKGKRQSHMATRSEQGGFGQKAVGHSGRGRKEVQELHAKAG